MKQLRFTTTKPGFFANAFNDDIKPLYLPESVGKLIVSDLKANNFYIHGGAEELAGFDIPIFIDGDLKQLQADVKEQDIIMILDKEYKCKAEYYDKPLSNKCYLITLFDEPSIYN